MIAVPRPSRASEGPSAAPGRRQTAWQDRFVNILPAIQKKAEYAFRSLDQEAREEAVQAAVALAVAAFEALVRTGREDRAFAGPLADYAVRQARRGRNLGGRLNVRDVSSRHCQRENRVRMLRLDGSHDQAPPWCELLVEARGVGPEATAAIRLDFADWLSRLSPRLRQVAELLATGEPTCQAAASLRVSPGRVSQYRRQLESRWRKFQNEAPAGSGPD